MNADAKVEGRESRVRLLVRERGWAVVDAIVIAVLALLGQLVWKYAETVLETVLLLALFAAVAYLGIAALYRQVLRRVQRVVPPPPPTSVAAPRLISTEEREEIQQHRTLWNLHFYHTADKCHSTFGTVVHLVETQRYWGELVRPKLTRLRTAMAFMSEAVEDNATVPLADVQERFNEVWGAYLSAAFWTATIAENEGIDLMARTFDLDGWRQGHQKLWEKVQDLAQRPAQRELKWVPQLRNDSVRRLLFPNEDDLRKQLLNVIDRLGREAKTVVEKAEAGETADADVAAKKLWEDVEDTLVPRLRDKDRTLLRSARHDSASGVGVLRMLLIKLWQKYSEAE